MPLNRVGYTFVINGNWKPYRINMHTHTPVAHLIAL